MEIKPPPASKAEQKSNRKSSEFKYCEVCRRNQDQGRKHKYIPSHVQSLSSFLSRFGQKMEEIRFFIKNPSVLRAEHAERNRLWCVFCSIDLIESDSLFACSNAIYHLASEEHFKKVKDFLFKHGGGMDRADSFRVSDADLIKWEKGCESLKNSTQLSKEGLIGPAKDIQNEITYKNTDIRAKTCISSFSTSTDLSYNINVMPLQSPTNENYPAFYSDFNGISGGMQDQWKFYSGDISTGPSNMTVGAIPSFPINGPDQRVDRGGDSIYGNVHTGAPPPWLESIGETQSKKLTKNTKKLEKLNRGKKSKQLNPRRVGAAWAEKRRAELEMEKIGEMVPKKCDDNWLPNFGRVWNSGSRRESKREFEKENVKKSWGETKNCSEISVQVKPYVSKRMHGASDKDELQINPL